MDRSLGGLARWLRLLGHDTLYDPGMDDRDLVRLAGGGRIVITRTRAVARRLGTEKIAWVNRDRPIDQLSELAPKLGLRFRPGLVFTRCLDCNQKVAALSRDQAAGRVPDHVLQTAGDFSTCPCCGRVFWRATHRQRALALLEKALPGLADITNRTGETPT